MKIGIAADHGGFELKGKLIAKLQQQGHVVNDYGPHSFDKLDDYPDFGIPAAHGVADGEVERAILICNNGIGMGMLANKIHGVRAAVVYSETSARDTREHHDSNVLCLGGREFSNEQLEKFVTIWLSARFAGGRHERRMGKVTELDR
ncbi:MAG: RpiB/LacA/LacB family sugar-phosphate isomerase [Verrucomicrobiales bacterium]|jgi:ribose 5-phosphate isomerase B|nr:RpiB/LacA/LacB family sugar-phosphate isomerase [Verrucomicrobiales bacterium]